MVTVDGVALSLPRRQSTGTFVDGDRLYVAQAGGYSVFEGAARSDVFPSELAGVPTTALAVADGVVWLGTQNRGLVQIDAGKVSLVNELHGLLDDWITVIDVTNGVRVGTFVGGAYEYRDGSWRAVSGTAGTCVTGFAGIAVATRQGVFVDGKRIFEGEATSIRSVVDGWDVLTRTETVKIEKR